MRSGDDAQTEGQRSPERRMEITSQKTMVFGRIFTGLLFLSAFLPCTVSSAANPSMESETEAPLTVEFIGRVEIAGDATDLSGLSGGLEDQSPINRLGGFSAIEYSGQGNRFVVLADRGAGDGAVSYPCRMQHVDLRIQPSSKTIQADWVSTVLLTATDGIQLDGSITTANVDRTQSADQPWHAMDPEGIRRWGKGWLISDEYGPNIGCFDLTGHLEKQWLLPESRVCCKSGKTKLAGINSPSNPASGCTNNRGLEGLAVTPSGSTVWAAYQSCLLQDGEMVDGKCFGDFTRWIAFDRDGNRTAEVAYAMDDRWSGISELLALDEHRMLALERDGREGEQAAIKRIYLADTRNASEVSNLAALPLSHRANQSSVDPIAPVCKKLLIDLMEYRQELGDAATAEKPEGLTWGPRLQDGRRTLWICWDNDFDPKRKSYIACFAINQ